MGAERKVKRTQVGGTSGSTITAVLWVSVLLDQPAEADDTFELVGTGGKYARTLKASEAHPLVAGVRILVFGGVKAKHAYRLVHHRSKGSERPITLDVPFNAMTSHADPPPSGKHTFLAYDSQVPKRLPDRYNVDRDVDPDLLQRAPILNRLEVTDPKI
jgi:hypothetical protein